MKKLIFTTVSLAIAATLSFVSCKKEDNNIPENSSTNNNTPNTITLTLDASGYPVGTAFSGVLIARSVDKVSSAYNVSQANFFSSPIVWQGFIPTPSNHATVASVYLNDSLLQPTSNGYSYAGEVSNLPLVKWVVVNGDSSSIPSFTYTNNIFPSYSGTNLPTNIDRNKSLTIPISDANDYDVITIGIIGYGNGGGGGHWKSAKSGEGNFTFESGSLANVPTGTAGAISVSLIKYNALRVSGKNFLFLSQIDKYFQNVTIQ